MWNDDKFPEFCPVRHLLAFLGMSGINEGYFFPSKATLDQFQNSNQTTHLVKKEEIIGYQTYLEKFKRICNQLNLPGRWGAHTGRKTGYLFAVWGGASDSDIMDSARHRTLKNAMKYKKDASFLLALSAENGIVQADHTPQWRSLWCQEHQLATSINSVVSPNYQSLSVLAKTLIKTHLNLPNESSWAKSVNDIGDALLKYNISLGLISNPREELTQVLSTLDSTLSGKIGFLVHSIVTELQASSQSLVAEVINDTSEVEMDESSSSTVVQNAKKRKVRGGTFDIAERNTIGKLKTGEQKLLVRYRLTS